jgi:hypothetical protein
MSGTKGHEKSLLNTFGNGRHWLYQSEGRTLGPALDCGPENCKFRFAMVLQASGELLAANRLPFMHSNDGQEL